MAEYRLRRRREFEHRVRRRLPVTASPWAIIEFEETRSSRAWSEYALWEEESQRDLPRARNVWDRAVAALPRVHSLWLKYVRREELAGAIANARQVFERWLACRPGPCPGPVAWQCYALLELRHGEVGRARAIYERLVREHPRLDSFLRYARFEAQHGDASAARRVYERAVAAVDPVEEGANAEELLAWLEETCRASVPLRARGPDRLPSGQADELRRTFIVFERQQQLVEDTVTAKQEIGFCNEEEDPSVLMNKEEAPIANKSIKRKRPAPAPAPAPAVSSSNLKILGAAYRWKRRKPN